MRLRVVTSKHVLVENTRGQPSPTTFEDEVARVAKAAHAEDRSWPKIEYRTDMDRDAIIYTAFITSDS